VHQMTIARNAIADWKDNRSVKLATGDLPL
jgi:hypothetical protein